MENIVPMGLAGLMFLSVGILCWLLLRSVRAHEKRHQELLALYRKSIELSETGQQLQAESNSIVRELIAELRAGRQAPGT